MIPCVPVAWPVFDLMSRRTYQRPGFNRAIQWTINPNSIHLHAYKYLHAIDSTWYFTQTKTLNITHSVLCNVTYDLKNKYICFLGIPVDVSPRNVHYMWFCSKTCLVGLLIRSIFRGKNCTSALVFGAGIHRWIYKLGTCNTASWWRPCC